MLRVHENQVITREHFNISNSILNHVLFIEYAFISCLVDVVKIVFAFECCMFCDCASVYLTHSSKTEMFGLEKSLDFNFLEIVRQEM